jgi:uncharacterized membrane protein
MIDLNSLVLATMAILGALASATLGWLDSGEKFSARKYASSAITAIFSGAVCAFKFQGIVNPSFWDFLFAAVTGAGFDVLGNRISGAIAAKKSNGIIVTH